MHLLSYTSASAFPAKVILRGERLKQIAPIHVQLNLTNRCNLNCSYCSCRNRDPKQEMPISMFDHLMRKLKRKGMEAVTITGGGEPLLYPFFDEVVRTLKSMNVKMGLVTNGTGLMNLGLSTLKELTWIRVSFDGHRKDIPDIPAELNVAFSYVYDGNNPDDPNLKQLIRMAEIGQINHLRIVTDIMNEELAIPLRRPLNARVIVQDRSRYTPGHRNCWIALLKPVVDCTGLFYPCCGTQYALKNHQGELPEKMCMGTLDDYIDMMVDPQIPFDGSICDKCFYSSYNDILSIIKVSDGIGHREFV